MGTEEGFFKGAVRGGFPEEVTFKFNLNSGQEGSSITTILS